MTRFLVLFSLFLASIGISNETDKSQYCPTVNQIRIIMRGEPNLYIYQATNSEGKIFKSDLYGGNRNNGPAPALNFSSAEYNEATKELICVYTAYSLYGFPVLVNKGDY